MLLPAIAAPLVPAYTPDGTLQSLQFVTTGDTAARLKAEGKKPKLNLPSAPMAARLLLERTIALLKAADPTQSLTLPDGTLTAQGRAVLASVASGELAPGQGAQLLAAIGSLARVAEVDELAARLAALEVKHGNA